MARPLICPYCESHTLVRLTPKIRRGSDATLNGGLMECLSRNQWTTKSVVTGAATSSGGRSYYHSCHNRYAIIAITGASVSDRSTVCHPDPCRQLWSSTPTALRRHHVR